MDFKPFKIGKYLLLERIATGGMAEVYRAKASGAGGFEKQLAVKRILPNYSANDEFRRMFEYEARLSSMLTHANIVQIYDFVKAGDTYLLAMEYVDGKNLRQVINKAKKQNIALPIEFGVYVINEVCKGLEYAHKKKDDITGSPLNIIHRDMSPQNIMLSYDGAVKIVDFGIAKAKDRVDETRSGVIKGKFGYMSPEQANGDVVDHRTDIFSTAIILYETLANKRLFASENDMATLRLIQECVVPPPSRVNPKITVDLEKIIIKGLTKDINLRFKQAGIFHEQLQEYLNRHFPGYGQKAVGELVHKIFQDEISTEKKRFEQIYRQSIPFSQGQEEKGSAVEAKDDSEGVIDEDLTRSETDIETIVTGSSEVPVGGEIKLDPIKLEEPESLLEKDALDSKVSSLTSSTEAGTEKGRLPERLARKAVEIEIAGESEGTEPNTSDTDKATVISEFGDNTSSSTSPSVSVKERTGETRRSRRSGPSRLKTMGNSFPHEPKKEGSFSRDPSIKLSTPKAVSKERHAAPLEEEEPSLGSYYPPAKNGSSLWRSARFGLVLGMLGFLTFKGYEFKNSKKLPMLISQVQERHVSKTTQRESKVGAAQTEATASLPSSALKNGCPLQVTTDPAGATVVLNGENRGTTPTSMLAPCGVNTVVIYREGFEPITESFRNSNEGTKLYRNLKKVPTGILSLMVEGNAKVFVDGKFAKDVQSGEEIELSLLTNSSHKVRFINEVYKLDITREFSVREGMIVRETVRLDDGHSSKVGGATKPTAKKRPRR